jgi:hypothetical protein
MPLLMPLQNRQSEIRDHNSIELNAPRRCLRCGEIPIARDLGHQVVGMQWHKKSLNHELQNYSESRSQGCNPRLRAGILFCPDSVRTTSNDSSPSLERQHLLR